MNQAEEYGDLWHDASGQLFLGNLPENATQEGLKQLLGVFGRILDLTIHVKQPKKGGPAKIHGFITFEDPASAVKLLESRLQPIFYPNLHDQNGHMLIIGEKKNRWINDKWNAGLGMRNRNSLKSRSDKRENRGNMFRRSVYDW